jgi:transcriptional regulator with XRE-family HTH domain
MANFTEKLGSRIREVRKAKGFSQEKLAEKANISTKYLGEVERGESSISAVLLNDISVALNVSISELMQHDHKDDSELLKKEVTKYINSAKPDTIQKIYFFIKNIL